VLPGGDDQTIYAAALYNPEMSFPYTPSRETVQESFGLIYSDWLAGS
jgi:hypothetical protein